MYLMDRTRIGKLVFGILAAVFAVSCVVSYAAGGNELLLYGFMNTPLAAIVMVVSLFSSVICSAIYLVINALEKDITEWLKILDSRKT